MLQYQTSNPSKSLRIHNNSDFSSTDHVPDTQKTNPTFVMDSDLKPNKLKPVKFTQMENKKNKNKI